MAYQKYINHNTITKANYHSCKKSIKIDKLFKFKTFAQYHILKCRNWCAMRVHNAKSTTRAFWMQVSNPIINGLNFVAMYFVQGIFYISVIPYLRLNILAIEIASKR